jgi:predicted RNA binding protein YcfA (HicA-like mRNA interferase family)
VLGYTLARQGGSHLRLTTELNGTHHVTVPAHNPIKVGTLMNGILKPIAAHHKLTIDALLAKLDL